MFHVPPVASRKLAMFHAGRNFNHQVQERRQADHQLVTTGEYQYIPTNSLTTAFLTSRRTRRAVDPDPEGEKLREKTENQENGRKL